MSAVLDGKKGSTERVRIQPAKGIQPKKGYLKRVFDDVKHFMKDVKKGLPLLLHPCLFKNVRADWLVLGWEIATPNPAAWV